MPYPPPSYRKVKGGLWGLAPYPAGGHTGPRLLAMTCICGIWALSLFPPFRIFRMKHG